MKTTAKKHARVNVQYYKGLPYFEVYQVIGYVEEEKRPYIQLTYLNKEEAEDFVERNSKISTHYSSMWVEKETVWL